MSKSIWIFNHYAGPPSVTTGLRHYNFAKKLINAGYPTTIFAASTVHNSSRNLIEDNRSYVKMEKNGVPFVFIRTCNYVGNGLSRIKNMIQYYRRLFKVTKNFEKPDVIIGSSVHPLACVAAIKLAKKYHCECIVEIRDLWPESIVAYSNISPKNPVIWILYKLEKWIYKKADKIIFTMEGGKDYILEKGWDKDIDQSKIYHINNGIDLEQYKQQQNDFILKDDDLDCSDCFKAIYTGSIRLTNNVGCLVDAARVLDNTPNNNVKILIYGFGDQLKKLQGICKAEHLDSIRFKGKVDKKYIPGILKRGQINILDIYKADIFRFGVSPNKLFDYLASGKPVLSGLKCNYDIIEKYNCGVVLQDNAPEEIAKKLLYFSQMERSEYECLSNNALKAAENYDFTYLTKKLIKVIEVE